MAKDINLNSGTWCDMIFENKNKAYGAYQMRQTSSKRHIIAFFIVLLFTAMIALIPQFMKAVSKEDEFLGSVEGPTILSDLTEPEEKDEIIVEPVEAPPMPKLEPTIGFPPPVITDAADVRPEEQMLAQEELFSSTERIGSRTVESDNPDGEHIDDVLRDRGDGVGSGTGSNPDPDPVDFVEQMPQFPGGQSALMSYLGSNMRYPAMAIENEIEGRVVVKFVVGKDGNISNVQIIKTLDPSCDKEAVRVVKSMPKWVAGRQNGHPVAVYFTLPVVFRLTR